MILINPYYVIPSTTYLVDMYSPIVAYSLRKISSTATNAIRVRRSSDNTEQDIGFIGDDLNTTALSLFVGSGSGFVTKWYNQGTGGASYDYTQSNAVNQPKIVNAGSLYTFGGKPFIYFNSGSQNFLTSTYSESSRIYSNGIYRTLSNALIYPLWRNASFQLGVGSVNNWGYRLGNAECGVVTLPPAYFSSSTTAGTNTSYISHGYWDNVEKKAKFHRNGITYSDSSLTGASLRSGTGGESYDSFYVTEILTDGAINWNDRTLIELDQNTYYGIY